MFKIPDVNNNKEKQGLENPGVVREWGICEMRLTVEFV